MLTEPCVASSLALEGEVDGRGGQEMRARVRLARGTECLGQDGSRERGGEEACRSSTS